MEEFYDLRNLYPIISLVANNYEVILNENKHVFVRCFENGGTYTIDRYMNDEYLTLQYERFVDLQKGLTKLLIYHFKLSENIPGFFNVIRLAIPVQENGVSNHLDFSNISELYYGAAPGSMQIIENGTLYYQYFFFEPKPIIYILEQKETFKGVLEKRQINQENINRINPFFTRIYANVMVFAINFTVLV